MKACLDEKQMLRLRWANAPHQHLEAFEAHVQACPRCAALWSEISGAWDALEGWSVEPAPTDLTERILAAAAQTPQADPIIIRWWAPARAAASVLLAVGLGVAAGQLIGARGHAPERAPAVTPEETAAALGLSALGIESATGLPLGLEPREETTQGDAP